MEDVWRLKDKEIENELKEAELDIYFEEILRLLNKLGKEEKEYIVNILNTFCTK